VVQRYPFHRMVSGVDTDMRGNVAELANLRVDDLVIASRVAVVVHAGFDQLGVCAEFGPLAELGFIDRNALMKDGFYPQGFVGEGRRIIRRGIVFKILHAVTCCWSWESRAMWASQ